MIEFENAGYAYGPTHVLREINLSLQPGSFWFLLGPSGAGKTTFLRLCYLDLFPTEGRLRFFGRTIGQRNRDAIADLRRTIGVVPQESPFLDHLSLLENIALPLQVAGIDLRDRAGDLKALLEWVDLTGQVHALPCALSGGERQRAAVARAVILSPALILVDEPSGHLDREMALRLLTLLIELNRMGKTVVIATHDAELMHAAAAQVDLQVLQVAGGRVLALDGAR